MLHENDRATYDHTTERNGKERKGNKRKETTIKVNPQSQTSSSTLGTSSSSAPWPHTNPTRLNNLRLPGNSGRRPLPLPLQSTPFLIHLLQLAQPMPQQRPVSVRPTLAAATSNRGIPVHAPGKRRRTQRWGPCPLRAHRINRPAAHPPKLLHLAAARWRG